MSWLPNYAHWGSLSWILASSRTTPVSRADVLKLKLKYASSEWASWSRQNFTPSILCDVLQSFGPSIQSPNATYYIIAFFLNIFFHNSQVTKYTFLFCFWNSSFYIPTQPSVSFQPVIAEALQMVWYSDIDLTFAHVVIISDVIPRVIPSTDPLYSPANVSENGIKHWDEKEIELLVRACCLWVRFEHDPLSKHVVANYKEIAESLGLT